MYLLFFSFLFRFFDLLRPPSLSDLSLESSSLSPSPLALPFPFFKASKLLAISILLLLVFDQEGYWVVCWLGRCWLRHLLGQGRVILEEQLMENMRRDIGQVNRIGGRSIFGPEMTVHRWELAVCLSTENDRKAISTRPRLLCNMITQMQLFYPVFVSCRVHGLDSLGLEHLCLLYEYTTFDTPCLSRNIVTSRCTPVRRR